MIASQFNFSGLREIASKAVYPDLRPDTHNDCMRLHNLTA